MASLLESLSSPLVFLSLLPLLLIVFIFFLGFFVFFSLWKSPSPKKSKPASTKSKQSSDGASSTNKPGMGSTLIHGVMEIFSGHEENLKLAFEDQASEMKGRIRELEAERDHLLLTTNDIQRALKGLREENENLLISLTEKVRALEREAETALLTQRKNERLEGQIREMMVEVERIFGYSSSETRVRDFLEEQRKRLTSDDM